MHAFNYQLARENMVKQQLKTWDVFDPQVLNLFETLPREAFVPSAFQHLAYSDTRLPLGNGHDIAPPREQARMLQALAIQSTDKILEIGTGCGFMTACLAKLGHTVTTVDIDPSMIEQAKAALARLSLNNITFKQDDGLHLSDSKQRYDVICVHGSVESLPQTLKAQLTVSGRLFAIIGKEPAMEATLITRLSETDYRQQALFETVAPKLVNGDADREFIF